MKKPLNPPDFRDEDEERDFWSTIDLSQYLEPGDLEGATFPNLKPTMRDVSLRLPEFWLVRLQEQANEQDIPYEALIKRYIKQGISEK